MINPQEFTKAFIENDLGPVIEVPCSYLKNFLNYLFKSKEIEVETPANEAIAMGLASGSYLTSGKIPIVAIQNSGFMITLNALTSLNQIYEIPIFYLITWRGEGGKGSDAPEHDITGENLKKYLKTFDLPFEITDPFKYRNQIKKLKEVALKSKKPVALIIRKNLFKKVEEPISKNRYQMTRLEAIRVIKNAAKSKAVFISSTGFPTRDSFNVSDTPDFYVVGSMGHTLGMALGVATNTNKKVVAMDGDGSTFMHLGGLSSFNPKKHKDLIYTVLDNESYESTGGQKTAFSKVNLTKIAKAFRFKNSIKISSKADLGKTLKKALTSKEPYFIQVKINKGGEAGKRVSDKYSCPQIKERFMENFKEQKAEK